MTQTIHVISHTHWDREWYLTFQQFRLKLVHLVDGLLELLEHDSEFKHFMLDGQTIVLDDYLFMRPENEAVLRQHVQSGRLLIGPWHILPDMFLVGPEAHIRNLLQGDRTARRFGVKMTVGYIPDPFGHPGQVPQILRGFGIEHAALWRGVDEQPCEFAWQSPDGSRVWMAFLRDSYSNGASLAVNDLAQFAAQLAQARDSLAAHSAARDVLVMFGTDHMQPPPNTSAALAYAASHLPDTRVLHSTFPAYFQAVGAQLSASELPVVSGELRHCSRSHLLPGVLSTRMWIKQRNYACETLLEQWAEPFSVFAANMPQPGRTAEHLVDPAPILRQAWRMLMENHPHDSICGCSIDQVHEEMKPRFAQVEQVGEEITRQSLQILASQVETHREGALCAVVVFNPSGAVRTDLAEVELHIPEAVQAFKLVDEQGKVVPFEQLGSREQMFANVLIQKSELRDLVGTIHEGRVAGSAVTQIMISRREHLALIEAVVDEHGQPNLEAWKSAEGEMQALESDPAVTHVHILARRPRKSQVRFAAEDIPAFGWRTYWAQPAAAPAPPEPARLSPLLKPLLPAAMRFVSSPLGGRLLARLVPDTAKKPPFVIENEFLRIEANPQDGTLTLTDRRTGAEYPGLNRFEDGGDAGDEYNYCPPVKDKLITARLVSVKASPQALPAVLEIHLSLLLPKSLAVERNSRSTEMVEIPVLSRVSLAPGVPRVEIHTLVENHAEDHRLRVHFPAPFQVNHADYDGHFEVVRRSLDVPEKQPGWVEDPRPEVPQRAFVDVSDGLNGLMIANRGLPEVEVLKTPAGVEIALTLLRSVGWLSRDDLSTRSGHAGPGFATPEAQMTGAWHFDYAVIPHAAGWQAAYPLTYAFQSSLRGVVDGPHPGDLPSTGAFLACSPPEFVLSAVKEAENGRGWIVRGCNLMDTSVEVSLKPLFAFTTAALANLAEETQAPLTPAADGAVCFEVRGYGIATVRFW
ncbi:MAG: glycosyl hydrolase-related protein [Anaerolineales bacterium]|jgi:alpha-mannosidase|nr:glycosyl hydrolase-related protein [Anaerolineales bacterium]